MLVPLVGCALVPADDADEPAGDDVGAQEEKDPAREGEGEGAREGEGEGGGQDGGGEGEGEPPSGPGTCAAPIALTCGATLELDTAAGAAQIDGYGCSADFSYPGRELVLAFSADAAVTVSLTASRDGGFATTWQLFDLGVGGDACAPQRACQAVTDVGGLPMTFDAQAGETRLLSVDPRGSFAAAETTAFTLSIACELPVCGDGEIEGAEACDDANAGSGDGCGASCTVEPDFACAGEPSSCSAVVCGDGRVDAPEGCDDDGTTPGDGCDGACAVEVGFVCAGAPSTCTSAGADTCAEAAPIAASGTTTFSTNGFTNDVDAWQGACVYAGSAGPDVFLTAPVPPHSTITASLADAFLGARLVALPACGADASLACTGVSATTLTQVNRTDATVDVVFAVDGQTMSAVGSFALATQTAAIADAPAGALCESALPLTPGVTVSGDTAVSLGASSGYSGGACGFGAIARTGLGRDVTYSVTVPAGGTLSLELSCAAQDCAADPVLAIVEDCTAPRTSCLVDRDAGSSGVGESLSYTNAGMSAQLVFVVVDAIGADQQFSFTLESELE